MKEYPILFSTEMIRAILDGRKTQTRRVIKYIIPDGFDPIPYPSGKWAFQKPGKHHLEICSTDAISCPYGKPGDRLWVRETWASHPLLNKVKPRYLDCAEIYYRATCNNDSHYSWRPSIHMPRWASRITLEVVDVRVERVQDISPQDALAEGIEDDFCIFTTDPSPEHMKDICEKLAIDRFHDLWDSLNKKRQGCSWEDNPWVWCVTFEVAK